MEMTVRQAAAALRVSRDTVLRLIRARQLVAHRKSVGLKRSAYVVDSESVKEYDQKRRA
jgi:excisionase family DNA binding protein